MNTLSPSDDFVTDAWASLRLRTDARVALGVVGSSLPTPEVLRFGMAHARARDAVSLALDTETLTRQLQEAGFSVLCAWSCAANRSEYLRHPDFGRRLSPACRAGLAADDLPVANRLTIVVADGLSSLATAAHALPLLVELRAQLRGWTLDSVVVATQARVALADEIGELRGAEAVVILLGERPGLSSPDSLGVYMTYAPRLGRTDAERNCISNVRSRGLSCGEAAYKLHYLLHQSRLAGCSGVKVKDASVWENPKPLLP